MTYRPPIEAVVAVCMLGGMCCPGGGGGVVQGGGPVLGGACCPGGGVVYLSPRQWPHGPSDHVTWSHDAFGVHTPPLFSDRMTDTFENITFARLASTGSKKEMFLSR